MARTAYGLPGIYNSSSITLNSGEGTALATDASGRLLTSDASSSTQGIQQTTITSSTAETTIITAGATGVFNDLYGIIIANTSASASNITIKDATSGTTRIIFAVPAGETRGFMLPKSAAIRQAVSASNWTATSSASVASIAVSALYITRS